MGYCLTKWQTWPTTTWLTCTTFTHIIWPKCDLCIPTFGQILGKKKKTCTFFTNFCQNTYHLSCNSQQCVLTTFLCVAWITSSNRYALGLSKKTNSKYGHEHLKCVWSGSQAQMIRAKRKRGRGYSNVVWIILPCWHPYNFCSCHTCCRCQYKKLPDIGLNRFQ
jgi:hypothetical protein